MFTLLVGLIGFMIGMLLLVKHFLIETIELMITDPKFIINTIILALLSAIFGYIMDGFVTVDIGLWWGAGILLSILIRMIIDDF